MNSLKSSNNSNGSSGRQTFSYNDKTTNPIFQDSTNLNETQKSNPVPVSNTNDIQTDCSYCLTLCEVSTLLSLQSPVCFLLLFFLIFNF